jgi:hypothetical protein
MQHLNLLLHVRMKDLQYTSETFKTLEIYTCNMLFQYNVLLLLGRMKARWRVFTGGGGGEAAAV